jgi:hypothetical protein
MSHKSLFQQGKITRQEYENAQYLKDSGQKNLYKLYEKGLDERAQRRERNAKLIEKGKPVPYIREAEEM